MSARRRNQRRSSVLSCFDSLRRGREKRRHRSRSAPLKLSIEPLEDRNLLAVVLPDAGGGSIGQGLVGAGLEDVLSDIPASSLDLVPADDTSVVYHAFPQEVNNVRVSGDLLNMFLFVDEQSDDVLLIRSLPAFNADLLENFNFTIEFIAGVEIPVTHLLGLDFPGVDAIVPNPEALSIFIPDPIQDVVETVKDVLDTRIFPSLKFKKVKIIGDLTVEKLIKTPAGPAKDLLTKVIDLLGGGDTGGVQMYLMDGNDQADLSDLSGVSQEIHGGVGDDVLLGGGTDDPLSVLGSSPVNTVNPRIELHGDEGADTFIVNRNFNVDDYRVFGGSGNDVLVVPGTEGNDIFRISFNPTTSMLETIEFLAPDGSGGISANEVQSVALPPGTNGGTFTLTFGGKTTDDIAFNASSGLVAARLNALDSISASGGSVSVIGPAGGPWAVEFAGTLAAQDQLNMAINGGDLTVPGGEMKVKETVIGASSTYNEVQRISIPTGSTDGTFRLTDGSETTDPIDATAGSGALRTALAALSSIGDRDNLRVSSFEDGASEGWIVEFVGDLAGTNPPQLAATDVRLTGHAGGATPATETTKGVPDVNEKQTLHLSGYTGTFRLGFDGFVTAPIPYNASAFAIEHLMEDLPSIGGEGNIDVTGSPGDWIFEFTGELGGANQPWLAIDSSGLVPVIPSPSMMLWQSQTAVAGVDEVQTISIDPSNNGGEFVLEFDGLVSEAIAYNASAGEVESALEYVLGEMYCCSANVTVSGASPSWTVTFVDGLGRTDHPEIIVDQSDIARDVTITVDTTLGGGTAVNEVQTISLPPFTTGGTFKLGFGGSWTGDLDFDESAANVEIALNGILAAGQSVSVFGPDGGPWEVEFQGTLAGIDVAEEIIGDGDNLIRKGIEATITETTTGQTGGETPLVTTTVTELSGIEQLRIDGGGGDDQLIVVGATTDFTQGVLFDGSGSMHLISTAASPSFTFEEGTVVMDGGMFLFDGDITLDAAGNSASASLSGTGAGDQLHFVGEGGGAARFLRDDQKKVTLANFAPTSQIELRGELGDDVISVALESTDWFLADMAINGGPGDDTLIGDAGDNTYDGEDGFDTIVIPGTLGDDVMDVMQTAADTLIRDVNSRTGTDTFQNVEAVRVEAGRGDDAVTVSMTHDLIGSLPMTVVGDAPNASDVLTYVDDGPGDIIVLRQGSDDRSGALAVGDLAPVLYEGIEDVNIAPLNPITSGTGSDEAGRVVVLDRDPFEFNDARLNFTDVGALASTSHNPTIYTAGDEDWYMFRAPKIGTFRFDVHFEPLAGLPGGGNLDIELYNMTNGLIVAGTSTSSGEQVTFSAAKGKEYYLRVRGATAEAINVYEVTLVEVDLLGPQLYDPDGAGGVDPVHITDDVGTARDESTYDLFDPKPSEDGPTPLVYSLTFHFRDLETRDLHNRFPEDVDVYPALDAIVAAQPGHYRVVGDANGVIPIAEVIVTNNPVVTGEMATATIELRFDEPLPDDRFTLTIFDTVLDPPGNKLDGENNAIEPHEVPGFPTGDGLAGGDFVARFTVDSRPEIGVWSAGSVYVDTTGSFIFDPRNADYTNRDIVYTLGFTSDDVFAGNFAENPGDTADGFDKLAAYGLVDGSYRWMVDTDNDGVPNLTVSDPKNINGLPVAGDFDGNPANGDEVGLFTGKVWWLDTNHDFNVDTGYPGLALPGVPVQDGIAGYPIVGDFDGDGLDDLGTWTDDAFRLDLAVNGFGLEDTRFTLGFIGVRERPVAADMDQDGWDDLGLWVPDRSGAVPEETGEWCFLVSSGESLLSRIRFDTVMGQNVIDFVPVPFGNDLYAQYGDEFAVPVVGNFDPPVGKPYSNNVPPEVTSIVPAMGSAIGPGNADIDVTFSKDVYGVDASDLVLSGTAAGGAAVGTPVNQGGTTWRFPVSNLVEGGLQLSLAPDAEDIKDVLRNDLAETTWSYNVVPEIDLLGTSFGVDPDNLLDVGTVAVSFQILNQEIHAAGPFDVTFYLSDDANIDPASDTRLQLDATDPDAYHVAGLAAGATHSGSVSLVVPASDPFGTDNDYYIGMVVDAGGDVTETNEVNNRNLGQDVDRDDVFYSLIVPEIDLLGTSFDVNPDNLFAIGNVAVSFEILNQQIDAAGPFDVKFYLSDDTNINPASDTWLQLDASDPDAYHVAGLAAGATHSGTVNLVVPASDPFGTDSDYHIGMVVDVDDDVMETNETNNRNLGQDVDRDNVFYASNIPVTVYETGFDDGLPDDWSVVDGRSDGKTWTNANPKGRANQNWSGPFMIADSDWAGFVNMDESLVTPTLDFSAHEDVVLKFTHVFDTARFRNWMGNGTADVDVRVGGGAWQNVARYQGVDRAGLVELDLSSTVDEQSDVEIRWHYYAAYWDLYWGVDNVVITGIRTNGSSGAEGEFTNPVDPMDVNGDGHVSPIDVLLLISYLNENGTTDVTPVTRSGEVENPNGRYYYDVNGDLAISPIDVLGLVVHLNSLANASAGGEGESTDGAVNTVVVVPMADLPTESHGLVELTSRQLSHPFSSIDVSSLTGRALAPATYQGGALGRSPGSSLWEEAADDVVGLGEILGDDLAEDILGAWGPSPAAVQLVS